MPVKWKPVPSWESLYEVSSAGEIRSLDRKVRAVHNSFAVRRGRVLKQVPKVKRYLAVTLADGVRRRQYFVHDLVLLAFRGEKPKGLQSCHWDGDLTNNALRNLRYDTPVNNQKDKSRHGRTALGVRHGMAKLTEKQVRAIRKYKNATNRRYLAKKYNITAEHVSAIVKRRAWKHI